MKLGIVGWCTDSGLGYEFRDALRNLPVDCAFVLSNAVKPTRHEALAEVPHVLSQPGALARDMEKFILEYRPDTILSWEIPGDWRFPGIWKKYQVRWVHVVHWDWFTAGQEEMWKGAKLIAPNDLCRRELWNRYGLESEFLPVPLDLYRFPFRLREEAKSFLSISGFGGCNDRRGLKEIVKGWSMMGDTAPPLTIPAQRSPREAGKSIPRSITFRVGNVDDPAELYKDADVCVQLSRFEGVGLTLIEAQACGLPVITTDAEPMSWLAPDLKVQVARTEEISISGKKLTSSIASPEHLVERVRQLEELDLSELSAWGRTRVEIEHSWGALRDRWLAALEE